MPENIKKIDASQLKQALTDRHSQAVQEKLSNAAVGIAGLGGLGSNVAISLARIGIGKLILVDFDTVDISNLNRQQYFIDQIGQVKTEALRDNLIRINPFVDYELCSSKLNTDNIAKTFGKCDVIVECFDKPDQKQMIVETVLTKTDIPVVSASGMAGFGRSNDIKTKLINSRAVLIGDDSSEINADMPLTAARVAIAAAHQANAAIDIIINGKICL